VMLYLGIAAVLLYGGYVFFFKRDEVAVPRKEQRIK